MIEDVCHSASLNHIWDTSCFPCSNLLCFAGEARADINGDGKIDLKGPGIEALNLGRVQR
jgi:hypothetical protein